MTATDNLTCAKASRPLRGMLKVLHRQRLLQTNHTECGTGHNNKLILPNRQVPNKTWSLACNYFTINIHIIYPDSQTTPKQTTQGRSTFWKKLKTWSTLLLYM